MVSLKDLCTQQTHPKTLVKTDAGLCCLWTGYTKPRQPDKIIPDGARQKSCWFYLASWTKRFEGNLKEVGQIVPDSARISVCLQRRKESGVIWLNLANFLQVSCNHLVQEARQNQHFFSSGSVWHDFVWLSGFSVARA